MTTQTITVDRIQTIDIPSLLPQVQPPCISVYAPMSRNFAEAQHNRLTWRNQLDKAEQSIRSEYNWTADLEELFTDLRAFDGDEPFWRRRLDGLVLLATTQEVRLYSATRPIPEAAVVADSFHIRPLIGLTQPTDRFHLLCLAAGAVKLYEGSPDGLSKIALDPDIPDDMAEALGGPDHVAKTKRSRFDPEDSDSRDRQLRRYFKIVIDAAREHHLDQAGLPVMIAALPEYHGIIREVFDSPHLIDPAIGRDPFKDIDEDQLHQLAVEAVEPVIEQRKSELMNRYGNAVSHDRGTDDLETIAARAVAGRVALLILDQDKQVAGTIDQQTGQIQRQSLDDPHIDDLLDDIAEHVMRNGGEVYNIEHPRMPSDTGAVAIFRD